MCSHWNTESTDGQSWSSNWFSKQLFTIKHFLFHLTLPNVDILHIVLLARPFYHILRLQQLGRFRPTQSSVIWKEPVTRLSREANAGGSSPRNNSVVQLKLKPGSTFFHCKSMWHHPAKPWTVYTHGFKAGVCLKPVVMCVLTCLVLNVFMPWKTTLEGSMWSQQL